MVDDRRSSGTKISAPHHILSTPLHISLGNFSTLEITHPAAVQAAAGWAGQSEA